ncbi:MAG: hypothetical protein IJP30_04305 [Clostridia bacterium]|nr:hypothetical protein [Clostridia bacterium]
MAVITFLPTTVVADRTPETGYMTIGKNSSGVNRQAVLSFEALAVPGTVDSVTLNLSWNNSAAGEGFSAAVTHCATVLNTSHEYQMSGPNGSVSVFLNAYSTEQPFTVTLSGLSANAKSTSKAVLKDASITVSYTPGSVRSVEVKKDGAFTPVSSMDVKVNGSYVSVEGASVRRSGTWEVLF